MTAAQKKADAQQVPAYAKHLGLSAAVFCTLPIEVQGDTVKAALAATMSNVSGVQALNPRQAAVTPAQVQAGNTVGARVRDAIGAAPPSVHVRSRCYLTTCTLVAIASLVVCLDPRT